jgi:hypothetical protein
MRTLQGRRHAVGVRGGWWLEQVDWTRKVGHPRTSILYGLLVLYIITRIIRKVFTKTIERNDGTKSVRSKLRKLRTRPKLILTAHTKPISPARTEPVPGPYPESQITGGCLVSLRGLSFFIDTSANSHHEHHDHLPRAIQSLSLVKTHFLHRRSQRLVDCRFLLHQDVRAILTAYTMSIFLGRVESSPGPPTSSHGAPLHRHQDYERAS